MSILVFNKLEIPAFVDRTDGPQYAEYKNTLVALMFTQRIEVFDSERSNDGPWEPLKLGTEVRRIKKIPKKKRKKGFKILQDNGILRASMTIPGAEFQETSTAGDEASIATNLEYSAIHNFGGTIKHPGTNNGFGRGIKLPAHSIDMPARPFDQFTEQHIQEIHELTDSYFNNPTGAFE